MSADEIIWTNTLYPQYQIYEHRLNSVIDRSWSTLLNQNGAILAKAELLYSGNGEL